MQFFEPHPLIESLEPRSLLSGSFAINPGFGPDNIPNGAVTAPLAGGYTGFLFLDDPAMLATLGLTPTTNLSFTRTPAPARRDATFLQNAARSNLLLTQAAQLAAAHSTDAHVQSFAASLAQSRTTLQQQTTDLATSLGLAPTTTLSPRDLQRVARLATLTGRAFDNAFANLATSTARSDLSAYTTANHATALPVVQAFTARTVPLLQTSLGDVQTLQASLPNVRTYRRVPPLPPTPSTLTTPNPAIVGNRVPVTANITSQAPDGTVLGTFTIADTIPFTFSGTLVGQELDLALTSTTTPTDTGTLIADVATDASRLSADLALTVNANPVSGHVDLSNDATGPDPNTLRFFRNTTPTLPSPNSTPFSLTPIPT